MGDWKTWQNCRSNNVCRFKVGDRVGLHLAAAKRLSLFKKELSKMKSYDPDPMPDENGKLETLDFIRIIQAHIPAENFQVVMTHFDKSIRAWVIWFISEKGEVFRTEQDHLIFLWSNLKPMQEAISKGKTAQEILGLPKEPPTDLR